MTVADVNPQHQASAPRTITRAIGALVGSELIARTAAFAATAVLARRLGPDGFGIIGFAVALSGYLALAVNSGLHDVGSREVTRAPAQAVGLYSSVATVRLFLAVGCMVILAGVAWVIPKPPVTSLVVLLYGLSFFSLAVDPTWVFKGLERPLLAGAGLVVSQVIYALGVVLLIQEPSDVTRVPVLQFAGELTAATGLCLLLFRHGRPRVALADGWRLLQRAGYLSLARMLRTLVISSDILLLGFLTTDYQVGLYSAAYRVAFLLMAVAGSISAAYMPSYTRVIQGDNAGVRRLVETSLSMALLIGAPLVAGVIVTARPLVAVLFGSEYAGATTAVQLLACSVGILFLNWCLSNVLIAAHRTRLYAAIHGMSAVLNILLNLFLIPQFGIEGAAAATLVAEAIILIPGVVILHRMNALPSAWPLMAPVAAAAGMGGVIVAVAANWPLAAQVALGGVVYTALVALFGPLALTAPGLADRPPRW